MKINQYEPMYGQEEIDSVTKYLQSGGWITEHTVTRQVEEEIKKFTGMKYCTMMCNGTVTILSILMAYDIGPGDEVIVPDFTITASATPISILGAKPIFVDVERSTLCCEMSEIIKKTTPKTKALMLVSINGRYPEDVHGMIDYCNGKDIKVIEDAAQSLGSYYDKNPVGTLGDIGSYSFSLQKTTTGGQGGCIITNNEEIYEKCCMIKDFGRKIRGIDIADEIGLDFKYTDLQSSFLLPQIKKLPERIKIKRQIYRWYEDFLSDIDDIEMISTNEETTPWLVDILVPEQKMFMDIMKENEIGTRPFYPALHTQPIYKNNQETFPNAKYIADHGVWLPSSLNLKESDIEDVTDTIIDIMKYG